MSEKSKQNPILYSGIWTQEHQYLSDKKLNKSDFVFEDLHTGAQYLSEKQHYFVYGDLDTGAP